MTALLEGRKGPEAAVAAVGRGAAADSPPAGPTTRKGLLSVVDQAVVSGTSFVASVVVGRACGLEGLGVYGLALSIVLFVRGLLLALVCSPYVVYCNRRRGDALAAYAGSALVHFLLLAAAGATAVAALAGAFLLGAGPAGLGGVVCVVAGALPFLLLREYVRQTAFAHLRMGLILALDVGVAALQTGGLVLLAHLGGLTVATAYATAGAAAAAACLVWFACRGQPLRFVPGQFGGDWRHNWSFGKWATASFLVGSTSALLTPWIVALACGEAMTGVLAACGTLVNAAGMYVTGVSNYLTPRAAGAFAEEGRDGLRRVLWRTGALFGLTLGPFCLAALLAGDLPVTLVYGGRYAGCGPILAVLALNTLVGSVGITVGNGLWAMDRPRANLVADVWTFGATLAATLCLTAPLGALGAAVGGLVGTTAGVVARCRSLSRLLAEAEAVRGRPGGGRA